MSEAITGDAVTRSQDWLQASRFYSAFIHLACLRFSQAPGSLQESVREAQGAYRKAPGRPGRPQEAWALPGLPGGSCAFLGVWGRRTARHLFVLWSALWHRSGRPCRAKLMGSVSWVVLLRLRQAPGFSGWHGSGCVCVYSKCHICYASLISHVMV